MDLRATTLPGCWQIVPRVFQDTRGSFVKTFHRESAAQHGLVTGFAEEFYSWSCRGVLRGLHFQLPPAQHTKVVTCLFGEVLDVVVDLRLGSPTFGRHLVLPLRAEEARLVYIPEGMAHGFLSLSEKALMYYQVTSVHSPVHDAGIRWDSAGINWPTDQPVVSERDAAFPCLQDFASPFRYCEVPE